MYAYAHINSCLCFWLACICTCFTLIHSRIVYKASTFTQEQKHEQEKCFFNSFFYLHLCTHHALICICFSLHLYLHLQLYLWFELGITKISFVFLDMTHEIIHTIYIYILQILLRGLENTNHIPTETAYTPCTIM